MEKSEKTREKIIETTIDLIDELGGDTEKVTIRKISERGDVSIGLINHYFGSKDKLIEQCVQRIIGGVVRSFRPELSTGLKPAERLKLTAKLVMDFLMENRQISRISILGDLIDPKLKDHTMDTVIGFANNLSPGDPSSEILINTFFLTAILQVTFLRKDVFKESMGIDFYDKSQRDEYIGLLIDKLIGGR